ncbi:uncharacterized protein [Cicer arietinum]|uniref:Uncharacterized protein LOC101499236 isoform X2 n=1 Tax=Cicer arietinum TaxID=3827 RepID=A0A3Q7YEU4_CICAR|nr:uncharacterized protein LOC101499236 isoform X2 [Cicer arietinum]
MHKETRFLHFFFVSKISLHSGAIQRETELLLNNKRFLYQNQIKIKRVTSSVLFVVTSSSPASCSSSDRHHRHTLRPSNLNLFKLHLNLVAFVVYMDEPSIGLDPASRKCSWNDIKLAKQDRAIILTTHSMEEVEALCDRLGVFVNGNLQCIGNPKESAAQHHQILIEQLRF